MGDSTPQSRYTDDVSCPDGSVSKRCVDANMRSIRKIFLDLTKLNGEREEMPHTNLHYCESFQQYNFLYYFKWQKNEILLEMLPIGDEMMEKKVFRHQMIDDPKSKAEDEFTWMLHMIKQGNYGRINHIRFHMLYNFLIDHGIAMSQKDHDAARRYLRRLGFPGYPPRRRSPSPRKSRRSPRPRRSPRTKNIYVWSRKRKFTSSSLEKEVEKEVEEEIKTHKV